ncbi:MAG: 50S ribosomal protein L21 [Candidatus Omnitrophica bacterium]|nr:50S ribosomal protein L21 [Candidatus Omnitrophota bacterium]
MFAIVEIAGYQYKVSEGDKVESVRLDAAEGQEINLDKVLMFGNDSDVRIGQPFLKDVKVSAKIGKHTRGEKMVAFKFRRRENYARTVGHRQDLTELTITKIAA